MIAALVLTIVCQGYPACEMQHGWPLLGVVVDPPEVTCTGYILPDTQIFPCMELGDIVPLGRLYQFPAIWPGEVAMLMFEEGG